MAEPSKLLERFVQTFTGYKESFVVHAAPFTKDEAKGKYKGKFTGVAVYGKHSYPKVPAGKEEGDCVPLTVEQYRNHLNGEDGVGVSPLLGSVEIVDGSNKKILYNVCTFGVIDIDTYGVSFTWLVRRLYTAGFRFSAFLSKSGGLHIYFLFRSYESAKEVRELLQTIVAVYGLSRIYVDKQRKSKVEVFPEHAERKPGLHDKGIFLPFYNIVGDCPNKMLTADGTLVGLEKALPIIESQFTSVKEIKLALDNLPYADAPYCIQMLLLSGALQEGSHRNDFMFTVALYLKLKHGTENISKELIEEANNCLEEPLEDKDIMSIFASVSAKDYPIAGQCSKSPMSEYCDKKQCAQRKYAGTKREKGNVASNIEFGKIYRMLAEQPYYLLEARLAGTESPFKMLHVKTESDFLNQRTIQTECIAKLNQVMWTVKQQVWEERLNEVMQQIQEKEVPKETDTTELSDLLTLFGRFLTHKQVQANEPYRINFRQVYLHEGVYYFSTDGFKDYLRIWHYNTKGCNLREQLLLYGCTEGEVFYNRADGSNGTIKCWKKPVDEALTNLAVFFDDVAERDTDTIKANLLAKEDKTGAKPVDDRKF